MFNYNEKIAALSYAIIIKEAIVIKMKGAEMNKTIQIESDKCIGCGLCIHDCTRLVIELEDNKAVVKGSGCNMCGHCVAICPCDAVSYSGSGEDFVPELVDHSKGNPDPEELLYFIKKRRSIRSFKREAVPQNYLDMIIEAGRFSPTGGNVQSNRFIIIRDKVSFVRDKVLSVLKEASEDDGFLESNGLVKYKKTWAGMKKIYDETGEDRLFYDPPAVVIITSRDLTGNGSLNAGIAASRMELAAYSLGLGICYIGMLKRAADYEPEMKEMLGIGNDEQFVTAFSIGFPQYDFRRMVERNEADVRYL